ncbi:MAG TPA: DUF1697 domain-containing protein [Ilumatobacteraceae bacterium]|jgi:uncharacterized protein (DUF1697 family)
MATWIVLLRAVNVGGRMLPMADLRTLLGGLGHTDVATYIQSGNAVLTTSRRGRQAIADEIAAEIERAHGLPVAVIMRTPDEMRAVLAANPFSSVVETARVVVTFLSEVPAAENVQRLEPDRFLPDRFELTGREIYTHYPNGVGPSKLTLDYYEKRLRVRGTARNLNTVAKLIELAGG